MESIRRFPKQEQLAGMMQEAGYEYVGWENMSLGVVAMHSGFKM